MENQVCPEVYAKAMVAAEKLRRQLEDRLVTTTAQHWSCTCNSCVRFNAGRARVVAVNLPPPYKPQIARWLVWSCDVQDNTGRRWREGICCNILPTELFSIFRNAFAGIDVRLERPDAQLYSCQPAPFNPSGRIINLNTKSPVFVRPRGDLSHSVWVNAELRIDYGLKQYATDAALIACNIDALEFGQQRGRGNSHYFKLDDQTGSQTFYIRIPDDGDNQGQDIYLPIARVLTANKSAGTATLELDQSVEVFIPA